ncbi:MAG TPA: hypothetical protein VFE24_04575 [Pirellulales bacterium]|jgi:hypothetical protein|nr:hypothetical protein [Pirellulales bacterium]
MNAPSRSAALRILLAGAVLAAALSWRAAILPRVQAAPPAPADAQVLVLKSGQVLAGKIERSGDRYLVVLPDGELRVRVADVESICRNEDEVYFNKRAHIVSDRAEEHLDLVEWCLRQGLLGHAADELSEAMRLDPNHPRIAVTQRHLEQVRGATQPEPPVKKEKGPDPAAQNEELDRLVRSLPPGAMEAFTTTIQPVLLNSCTTSGCHGARGNSSFQMQRLPLEHNVNPRLTQRNLQAVLGQVNLKSPDDSLLLFAATQPHGTLKTPVFTSRQAAMYQQLSEWIQLVAQGDQTKAESHPVAAQAAMLQTLSEYGFGPIAENESETGALAGRRTPGLTGRLIQERKDEDKAARAEEKATGKKAKRNGPRVGSAPPADPFDPDEFNRATAGKKAGQNAAPATDAPAASGAPAAATPNAKPAK